MPTKIAHRLIYLYRTVESKNRGSKLYSSLKFKLYILALKLSDLRWLVLKGQHIPYIVCTYGSIEAMNGETLRGDFVYGRS